MDLWDLESAIALWNMNDPDQAIDRQMMVEFKMKPLRDMTIAAVTAGKLKTFRPCEDPVNALFEPRVFILWAQTKGLPTPQWWDDLTSETDETTDAPTQSDKPMSTKERRTLHVVIGALCQKNKIDPRSRDAVARLVALTQETGAAVGEDTIRKILKELPESIELRMK